MTALQYTETRWSKSFPTVVTSPVFPFVCSHRKKVELCNKRFPRQCDLRRHEKNHTRSAKCKQCQKAFAFTKDLERHENTVHNLTIKYFCPHEWCRDSIKLCLDDCIVWGFRRKDHWQKHMKDEHQTSQQALRSIQKDGIPMAVLKDEAWSAVLPKTAQAELIEPSSMGTTDTAFQDQKNPGSSAQTLVSGGKSSS